MKAKRKPHVVGPKGQRLFMRDPMNPQGLTPGDRVRNRLRPQHGTVNRMEAADGAAYVHWDEGSEQLCLLTDLEKRS